MNQQVTLQIVLPAGRVVTLGTLEPLQEQTVRIARPRVRMSAQMDLQTLLVLTRELAFIALKWLHVRVLPTVNFEDAFLYRLVVTLGTLEYLGGLNPLGPGGAPAVGFPQDVVLLQAPILPSHSRSARNDVILGALLRSRLEE